MLSPQTYELPRLPGLQLHGFDPFYQNLSRQLCGLRSVTKIRATLPVSPPVSPPHPPRSSQTTPNASLPAIQGTTTLSKMYILPPSSAKRRPRSKQLVQGRQQSLTKPKSSSMSPPSLTLPPPLLPPSTFAAKVVPARPAADLELHASIHPEAWEGNEAPGPPVSKHFPMVVASGDGRFAPEPTPSTTISFPHNILSREIPTPSTMNRRESHLPVIFNKPRQAVHRRPKTARTRPRKAAAQIRVHSAIAHVVPPVARQPATPKTQAPPLDDALRRGSRETQRQRQRQRLEEEMNSVMNNMTFYNPHCGLYYALVPSNGTPALTNITYMVKQLVENSRAYTSPELNRLQTSLPRINPSMSTHSSIGPPKTHDRHPALGRGSLTASILSTGPQRLHDNGAIESQPCDHEGPSPHKRKPSHNMVLAAALQSLAKEDYKRYHKLKIDNFKVMHMSSVLVSSRPDSVVDACASVPAVSNGWDVEDLVPSRVHSKGQPCPSSLDPEHMAQIRAPGNRTITRAARTAVAPENTRTASRATKPQHKSQNAHGLLAVKQHSPDRHEINSKQTTPRDAPSTLKKANMAVLGAAEVLHRKRKKRHRRIAPGLLSARTQHKYFRYLRMRGPLRAFDRSELSPPWGTRYRWSLCRFSPLLPPPRLSVARLSSAWQALGAQSRTNGDVGYSHSAGRYLGQAGPDSIRSASFMQFQSSRSGETTHRKKRVKKRQMQLWRPYALLASLPLVAGWNCLGTDPDLSVYSQWGTVTLDGYNWRTGNVTNWIAKIILEEALGYPTTIVPCPNSCIYNWNGLSDGSVMASLEVWIDASPDREQIFLDRSTGPYRTLEGAGPSGLISQIGWFTQMWTMDTYPELASYRGLQRQFNGSARFALTSSALNASGLGPPDACPDCGARVWNTTASGYGALFAVDPSWAGDLQSHIALNNLSLVTEWTGSEAALADTFVKLNNVGQPVLLALPNPHYILTLWTARNDSRYRLSQVSLPEYDPKMCNYSCSAYPNYVVQKIVNSGLSVTNPEIYWLIRFWTISNADVDYFLAFGSDDGLEDRDAACLWVKTHRQTWSQWLWFRQCPNNCTAPNGLCFNNQCLCHGQWSGSDCSIPEPTYQTPIIVTAVCYLTGLILVYVLLRRTNNDANNAIVFTIGFSICKYVADAWFWMRYASFTTKSVYVLALGVLFIAGPALLFFIVLSMLLSVELKENSSFRKYMDGHNLVLCAIMMLASLSPNTIYLSSSKIANWKGFGAPYSIEFEGQIKILSLSALVIQDLPQIGLQIYVSATTGWVAISIAALCVTLASLVFESISNIFSHLIIRYREVQSDTRADLRPEKSTNTQKSLPQDSGSAV
ncbi:uncharacterized protein BJ171DRAFT_570694 [Polychytrium aggregatum]|uniref:uncharacterized protein n=1 Tax=Polychytrium aggregatum TaxID=110093 RepID=UPI0022FDFE06|nr:uncharacterized protein BJ171DRAFT_570694 [Polychytrium aggregatum]KAI9197466.1 hypothetical protein BJ171DRAFT_570694 [Polychytrium aggregatum]